MNILIITILFLSALFGGLIVFFIKKQNTQLLKLVLSFSGSYLFSITILHLIPEVYASERSSVGLFILGGFLFQLLLEQFSEGIEHGHIHKQEAEQVAIVPLGIMLSLCIHAFLEGMPLAKGHQKELLFGIAIHHVPAAFALSSLLLQTAMSRKKIILMLITFALMSPLGFLTSTGISNGNMGNIEQYYDQIMAVVIGIFLHISTTILFESSSANHHHFNRKKLIAILLGMGISLLNYFVH